MNHRTEGGGGPRRHLWVMAAVAILTACSPAPAPVPNSTFAQPTLTRTPAPTLSPTAESSTTPSATAEPTATVGPTPAGGAAELIFGVVERIADGYAYGPIYRYQVVEGYAEAVTPGGYEFLGLSPAGDRILARSGPRLVLLDVSGMEKALLTDHLRISGGRTAVWMPGASSVVFLEEAPDAGATIYDVSTGARRPLADTTGVRELMLPSSAASLVVLGEPCSLDGLCESASAVDLDTDSVTPLAGLLRPSLSPPGEYLAYLYADDEGKRRLALAPADRSREVRPGVPGDNILDYVWAPDGRDLLVVALVRSDYSGRWFGSRQFLVTPGSWAMRELPQTETANALGLWSLDGRQVVLAGTEPDPDGYVVTLRRIDVSTRRVEVLDPGVGLSSPNYVFVSMMAWRPLR